MFMPKPWVLKGSGNNLPGGKQGGKVSDRSGSIGISCNGGEEDIVEKIEGGKDKD